MSRQNTPHVAVLDPNTGGFLYNRHADESIPPASLTKVMTMYSLLEQMKEQGLDPVTELQREIVIPDAISELSGQLYVLKEGRNELVRPGETYRVQDLLELSGSHSDANATAALVLHYMKDLPGDHIAHVDAFIARMNGHAEEMGLNSTHFENITGYSGEFRRAGGQPPPSTTTARDMAKMLAAVEKAYPEITREALDGFKTIGSGREHTSESVRSDLYGVEYGKTGTTTPAGSCRLLKTDDGLIVAVLGGRSNENAEDEAGRALERSRNMARLPEGVTVTQIQEGLLGKGYDLGRWGADGDFGPVTRAALARWKADNGLPEGRDVSPQQWALLQQPQEVPTTPVAVAQAAEAFEVAAKSLPIPPRRPDIRPPASEIVVAGVSPGEGEPTGVTVDSAQPGHYQVQRGDYFSTVIDQMYPGAKWQDIAPALAAVPENAEIFARNARNMGLRSDQYPLAVGDTLTLPVQVAGHMSIESQIQVARSENEPAAVTAPSNPPAPTPETAPGRFTVVIGQGGNLTEAARQAAAELGLSGLSSHAAYVAALRAVEAEENRGITNPDSVNAGDQIVFKPSDFQPGSA